MKALFVAATVALTSTAWAQTAVKVDEAWVRGTVAQQTATGAFMRLTASQNARLVAVESPAAGVVEIHEMAMDNNVMKMRAVPGLDLSAGRTVELKPGGYHVMLMDLKKAVKAGDTVPLTLVFEGANQQRFTQKVDAPVKSLTGSTGQAHTPSGSGHQHKH